MDIINIRIYDVRNNVFCTFADNKQIKINAQSMTIGYYGVLPLLFSVEVKSDSLIKNGHLFSKVSVVRNPEEIDDTAYNERYRNILIELMNHHMGNQQFVDLNLIVNRFHCLPEEAEVTSYWQSDVTQVALIQSGNEIYIHAELLN